MAKRKKAVKRSSRRRRVSGIMPAKDSIQSVAGVLVGLVGASYIQKLIPETLDAKIKAAALIAGGLVLMKQKNALIKGAAQGLAAVGSFQLVNALRPGTLPAIGRLPSIAFDNPSMISGFNSYPNNPQRNTIAGFNSYPNNPQLNTIAGVPNGSRSSGSGLG